MSLHCRITRLSCISHAFMVFILPLLAVMQKKPKSYSAALMDQIPIKYLVTQAHGLQQELGGKASIITFYCTTACMLQYLSLIKKKKCFFSYPGLHSALLRLLATNYPHLCLVEDWVCEEEVTGTLPLLRKMMLPSNTCRYTQSQLYQGESNVDKGS